MKSHAVTFLPDNRTVRVAEGKSLLEAAAAAGVGITSVCAGNGVCGKCRVTVTSGRVTAAPSIFVTPEDAARGVALACRAHADGDAVVEVPVESRTGGVPQLASEDAIRFGRVSEHIGDGKRFRAAPLSRKQFVPLPPPRPDDSLCDQERLYRELRKSRDIPSLQMDLSVLRRIPGLLRQSGWKVTALLGWREGVCEVMDVEAGDTSARNYGVAVDIGTTTVVAHLVDLTAAETLATRAKYNSQIRFGEDVISRIMYASRPDRLAAMRDAVLEDVNGLIASLAAERGVGVGDISYVVCAGNTTMTHFLLGLDAANIRRDPYVPAVAFPSVARASEVGVNVNPRGLLAAVPCVSSYVGGDVVADVMVSGMMGSSDVSLLVDLGTNGELVLGNADWLLCCSASAGPAFEGGGITCGMRATTGAIERVTLGEGGAILGCDVVGRGKPIGICGSGLIDLAGELLRVGCIDRTGRLLPAACGVRFRETESGDRAFLLFPAADTALGREIVLTESDIRNLIHTKGSIYMAAECMLEQMGLTFNDVRTVYLAGGFGNYLKVDRAIAIGLLPDLPHERFRFIGNGSVQGAKMAMFSEDAMGHIRDRIAGAMTYLELSTHHKYMNEYSSCLFLPHTNLEKFPSVLAGNAGGRGARSA